jgi:RimJ/RimL family protein N-acetyltransferase
MDSEAKSKVRSQKSEAKGREKVSTLTAKAELRGRGVVLRPLRKSDGDGLFRHIRDPKIARWLLNLPQPYRRKDMDEFLKRALKATRSGQRHPFTIRWADSDEPIGLVELMRHPAGMPGAEIGYWLARPFWGKGIMTQAVKLLIAYGFDTLKLHRLSVGHLEPNDVSRRVIEKCWFRREGMSREALFRRGKWVNIVNYGLLEPEYRRIRNLD